VFVVFPYLQLVVPSDRQGRSADFKYPDETAPSMGVCFFENEELTIEESPIEHSLTFVPGSVVGMFPRVGSSETNFVARWADFAQGRASLKSGVLDQSGDFVRVQMPGGRVSSGFVAEPIALIDFDYIAPRTPFPFAQEIVVSMTFADSVNAVSLRCDPFDGKFQESVLTFTWGGRPSIDLLFGNGSLASLQSVLSGSTAGHDHQGDFDIEFDVMFDIIDCPPDGQGRQPLPHIRSSEVLHVPCTSTMIASGTGTNVAKTSSGKKAVSRAGETEQTEWAPRTASSQTRERRKS
jgi:hypothetical protein